MELGLHIGMFAPVREQCGISDYAEYLIAALRNLPEIAGVQVIAPPSAREPGGILNALQRFGGDERLYRELGAQLNKGVAIAHIQHQYFLFGGVAPHKNHTRAFLNALRVPAMMTVHEIALPTPEMTPAARRALHWSNRANFLHPSVRLWLVHTQQDKERLATIGVPTERIHVVTHGVPDAPPLPDRAAARRKWNLEGRRVITLFGFLSTKKGHRVALNALEFLPEDVTLVFAGGQHPDDHTDYAPTLENVLAFPERAGRVCLTGYLPEAQVSEIMAATDIAIAPYLETSGSGSLARLLSHGLPVVASDIPPHREIEADTPGCLRLFPSGDHRALAEQIKAALTEPATRQRLQTAARAYAQKHSYPAMARETLKLYRLVLGRDEVC